MRDLMDDHLVASEAGMPARDRIRVVDLERGRVTSTIDLPHTPDEVVANAG